ncbi:unnamed protein product, partial [Owenia fusiformis]
MKIMKYGATCAIVLVLDMVIGANTVFGETIGSCPKREQMLCKKRDIISLWKELSHELGELKEEMVNINETVNNLKKDELGELKQEIDDIKEALNDVKKEILGIENPIQIPPHMDCSGNRSFTGVRTIQPHGQNAFRAYCSGGCVYIARRFDGSVDFYRDWVEYQSGFGNPEGEYFIGLDNLHGLVTQEKYKLR